jgi:hypothetical protein
MLTRGNTRLSFLTCASAGENVESILDMLSEPAITSSNAGAMQTNGHPIVLCGAGYLCRHGILYSVRECPLIMLR